VQKHPQLKRHYRVQRILAITRVAVRWSGYAERKAIIWICKITLFIRSEHPFPFLTQDTSHEEASARRPFGQKHFTILSQVDILNQTRKSKLYVTLLPISLVRDKKVCPWLFNIYFDRMPQFGQIDILNRNTRSLVTTTISRIRITKGFFPSFTCITTLQFCIRGPLSVKMHFMEFFIPDPFREQRVF